MQEYTEYFNFGGRSGVVGFRHNHACAYKENQYYFCIGSRWQWHDNLLDAAAIVIAYANLLGY